MICRLTILSILVLAPKAHAADLAAVRDVIADPRGLEAPGCVTGAFRNGEPLFITGAGAADIEQRKPLDGDSIFYAASVSKQFTALASAKLMEEGKLALDDDIRRYLPELPVYRSPITVGMLMHHTSGVRDWTGLYRIMGGGKDLSKPSYDALLQSLLRQRDTNFAPGTQYQYSNGGYLLLAEIVSRVSGMPFPEYATQAILEPLKMTDSSFLDGAFPRNPNLADGYVSDDEEFELRNTFPLFSGSGGLMTSMNDLAKYERDIATSSVVWTPAVREIMLTPGTLDSGQLAFTGSGEMAYGGGLMIGRSRGQNFVAHGGSAETFGLAYVRLPERKLAVIVACNRGYWSTGSRTMEIIELIEGDILEDEQQTESAEAVKAGSDAPSGSGQTVEASAPMSQAQLENLAGRYISDELPTAYHISVDEGVLRVTVTSPYTETYDQLLGGARCDANGLCGPSGFQLKFEPGGQGFTVHTEGANGVRFERAPT